MVTTSPPFYALRDYGVSGQIGMEGRPEDFIAKLVEVFSEVHRVLRGDGTLWIEIGDSYASTSKGSGGTERSTLGDYGNHMSYEARQRSLRSKQFSEPRRYELEGGLKPKDLIGVPWMLAFALRAEGWYLRSEVIWHKPDAMPESVNDRPTKSHSTIFLFSKQPRYFYDADAIREPYKTLLNDPRRSRLRDPRPPQEETLDGSAGEAPRGPDGRRKTTIQIGDKAHGNYDGRQGAERWPSPLGANARSVWTQATEATSFAHYAAWPQKLVAKMIMAGTSEHGACQTCGAPWQRLYGESFLAGEKKIHGSPRPAADERGVSEGGLARSNGRTWREREMLGWEATCGCGTDSVRPCVVLDPFGGSGTTGLVARNLGRHAVLIELSERYCEIASERLQQLSLLSD